MLNERVKKLSNERDRLFKELQELRSQLTGFSIHNGGGEFSEEDDHELKQLINQIESTISALDVVIDSAKGIEAKDSDTIEVGSTFKFTLSNGYSNTVTLVHNLSKIDSAKEFITTKSPLGAAVLGKKEGEEFAYTFADKIANKSITMTGIVDEIYKKEISNAKVKK